mgnify:CR=1 FL=1
MSRRIPGQQTQFLFNRVDDAVRRRSAGGDADGIHSGEPFRPQVRRGLHVMNAQTIVTARLHEFARVVAVRAADDHDDVAVLREFNRGALPLFGGPAHRVDETNLRLGKAPHHQPDQVPDLVDRLSRLGGNAEAWTRFQLPDVLLIQDHVELGEILRQAAHFDVVAFADDHWMKPGADEFRDGLVGHVHERARGLQDIQSERARPPQRALYSSKGPPIMPLPPPPPAAETAPPPR